MKNIQVLINYSPYSPQLWHFSLNLAKQFNATLSATHIFHPDYLDLVKELALLEGEDADDQYESFLWMYKKMEEERLNKFIDQLTPANLRSVKIEKELIPGYPIIEILKMQEENRHDLIIMGLEAAKDSVNSLDDTAQGLINYGEVPMLIVPPSAKYHPIRHMIIPTDKIEAEMQSLDYLTDWIDHLNAKLFCYHLHEKAASHTINQRDLLNRKSLESACKNEKLILTSDVGKKDDWIHQVEHMTTILDADILTICTHGTNTKEGVFEEECIKKFTNDLDIPILIVKDAWLGKLNTINHIQNNLN